LHSAGCLIVAVRRIKRQPSRLHKLSQRGFRGYPVATIALYGPNADRASKVAVAIVHAEGAEPDPIRRWFSERGDVRFEPGIDVAMLAFIREHGARSVVMTDRIIGCPHQEGIDYPEGEKCPQCPYWADRDRFTHELLQ